ncbi:uncharacterized protein [Asterias amurensis]|uniref:uncharacterized protein n=1 Tax=Asterias amurensis TaxID=7602 RepID=UPI003AB1864B
MAESAVGRKGDESPTTHLDCTLEDSAMSTSGYAQVVFHNVQERYTPGSHIECTYTLTPAIQPATRDWVGIFKVGWSSTRQYKAFDWAPYPTDWVEGREYDQTVRFSSYYLPKEEDGEFYQFCFIDSAGKMRGASTPFQFLDRSSEDFVEVEDASMGLLMIQSKSSAYEEQLKKIIKEKDELLETQSELQSHRQGLESKIVNLEQLLKESRESDQKASKENQELKEQHQILLREKTTLEGRIEEVLNALSSLEQDKTRCEKALEVTKIKLQEAQNQTAKVSQQKDQLVKDLSQVLHERDEFKSQFASSENSNKELRNEVSSLLHQLSQTSQVTLDVKEQEAQIRNEKRKVEQLLLVATADKDHMHSIGEKLRNREDQYAACEASRRLLCTEVDTMKAVHHKLSNDLQRAETEKDALKGLMRRKEKEFKDHEKQLRGQFHLQSHQAREREVMILEQVGTLKGSIKLLAEEKEQALRSNKGPMEASQVVMKELKEKLKRTQSKLEEETKKRTELQKKLSTSEAIFAQEKNDLTRDINDMRQRLQMGAEEYKKKYLECLQLEGKLNKKKTQRSRAASKEEVGWIWNEDAKENEPVIQEVLLQASPTPAEKSFDNAEIQQQITVLAQELEERGLKVKKYKELFQAEKQKRQQQDQLFQKERATFEMQLDAANSCAQELDEKEEDIKLLQDKISKLHTDYMKMKHTHEVYKFDVLQKSSQSSPPSTPTGMSPIHSPKMAVCHGPPNGQLMFRNPYVDPKQGYQNPYNSPEDATKHYGNPYKGKEEITAQPSAPPSPPGLTEMPAVPTLAPKNPPEKKLKSKAPLPEPLKPDVLPEGKIAAIKTVAKHHQTAKLLDLALSAGYTESAEEEREEGPTEFHDACEELPLSEGGLKIMKCPECEIEFPPSFPEADFVAHIQQHFARLCPMCNMLMPCKTPDEEYERHVQTHFGDD